MPSIPPVTASGRALEKRPRPLPPHVRAMVKFMVFGRPGDDDARPLDFVEAGRLAGIKPDIARKWLDKPAVRSLIRSERQAFRLALCSGNEQTLQRLRDSSANSMVQLKAVQMLEQLQDEAVRRPQHQAIMPGFIIQVVNPPANVRSSPVVDVTPAPAPKLEVNRDAEPEPRRRAKPELEAPGDATRPLTIRHRVPPR